MTTLQSDAPITPLRQRMQQDIIMRGLVSHTPHDYVWHVRRFTAFLGRPIRHRHRRGHPALPAAPALERRGGPTTINSTVSALRFLFTVTLNRRNLARTLVITRNPRKLPEVLSVEEAARLLEAAPGIKYKAALGVAYGAGLRVSEVAQLKVDDIDSTRMLIRVEQGKGRRDRNAILAAASGTAAAVVARRQAARGHASAWLAVPGRSCTDPISSRQLHRAVREAAEVAGIHKRVSPHTLFRAASETMLSIAGGS